MINRNDIVAFNERCDKCSARALVAAYFYAGELYFCLHHFKELQIGEKAYFLQFVDELEATQTTPTYAFE